MEVCPTEATWEAMLLGIGVAGTGEVEAGRRKCGGCCSLEGETATPGDSEELSDGELQGVVGVSGKIDEKADLTISGKEDEGTEGAFVSSQLDLVEDFLPGFFFLT